MLTPSPSSPLALRQVLLPLIESHGFWLVLRAAFSARGALRREARRAINPGDLNAHLRRDIGLPPEAPPGRVEWQNFR
ncbi:hypothetical protein [Celeribacter persicus]|jgi:hypothetical protein|uniref:DUF1127 domain-containing protein n=1 Tax=Celeribacter persicus TaxID=1651082 RepID=A0A2T5HK58_9RHOB|nr:hypothetical protein [Celeribacter persicus]PTQ71954.1 hypothetical protein C8N42_107133 [Celeribacter persicus]